MSKNDVFRKLCEKGLAFTLVVKDGYASFKVEDRNGNEVFKGGLPFYTMDGDADFFEVFKEDLVLFLANYN
jgi:hypothetical protein